MTISKKRNFQRFVIGLAIGILLYTISELFFNQTFFWGGFWILMGLTLLWNKIYPEDFQNDSSQVNCDQ